MTDLGVYREFIAQRINSAFRLLVEFRRIVFSAPDEEKVVVSSGFQFRLTEHSNDHNISNNNSYFMNCRNVPSDST